MQKEQKELFEKNNGEEKNTKASKIKKENNNTKSKYFIPVTRNNLYSILASGLVVPSSNYYDYEDDLQSISGDKIIITKDGFNFSNLNDLEIDSLSSCGVLLEIDVNQLDVDLLFDIKKNKFSKTSIIKENKILFYGKSISMNNIKTIYFQKIDELDDFRARVFENVPIENKVFNIDEEIFNVNLSKNDSSFLKKIKEDKGKKDFTHYQYSDSISCLIATSLFFLPAEKHLFEFFKDFLENIIKHEKFILPKNSKSNKLDEDLFQITINLLVTNRTSDGWQPKDFLNKIYKEIIKNKYDKASIKKIENWYEVSNDIIDNKREAPSLKDDNFIVGRAILLLLLRPSPEDLISAQNSSLEPGNIVLTLASMFVGARFGIEALSNEYKMVNDYSLEFFQDIKSLIFNKDKNSFDPKNLKISENFKKNSFETSLQLTFENKILVTKINDGPVELNKIMLLAKSRKDPLTLNPEREFNRLAYKYEFDKGKRSQNVYIKVGKLTKDGHKTLRFYSPCFDLSTKKNIDTLKKMLWDILIRQNQPERFCRFAIDEELKQFIVMKDEIDHSDISKELDFLKHIAKVADQFEKEFGLDKY